MVSATDAVSVRGRVCIHHACRDGSRRGPGPSGVTLRLRLSVVGSGGVSRADGLPQRTQNRHAPCEASCRGQSHNTPHEPLLAAARPLPSFACRGRTACKGRPRPRALPAKKKGAGPKHAAVRYKSNQIKPSACKSSTSPCRARCAPSSAPNSQGYYYSHYNSQGYFKHLQWHAAAVAVAQVGMRAHEGARPKHGAPQRPIWAAPSGHTWAQPPELLTPAKACPAR